MKNLIYLFIISLFLACSCKSKSFMTQRYTHLGHAKHTQAPGKSPAVAKQRVAKSNLSVEPVLARSESQALALAENVSTLPAGSETKSAPGGILGPVFKTGNKAISLIKSEVQKSKEQQMKPAKTVKEKMHRAAGLFDTLFKIVLFAIILAILVAVIIILILT